MKDKLNVVVLPPDGANQIPAPTEFEGAVVLKTAGEPAIPLAVFLHIDEAMAWANGMANALNIPEPKIVDYEEKEQWS